MIKVGKIMIKKNLKVNLALTITEPPSRGYETELVKKLYPFCFYNCSFILYHPF